MEDSIKIGLDAKRIVRNGTGLGSYGRTLANDLAGIDGLDLMLYAPDKGRDSLRNQVAERENLHFCYPNGLYQTALGKAFWRSKGIISQMQHDGIQVYHGLSGELPVGIRKSGIKSVVTIHDLIFMRHPEWYNAADVKIYTNKFRHAIHEADRIVAISECTRRDIAELGDIDPARIDLIYQSCAPRFTAIVPAVTPAGTGTGEAPVSQLFWYVRDHYDLPDRYILSVGTIEERKNALLAVKALHYLPDDLSLVLVGRSTPYAEQVWQYAVENGLGHRVAIHHGVPDDHLPAFYRMAEAFVYPSRYEGFGIPVIEAISMGLPVVACTGSCLEEAGGPHSLYVSPGDERAMAAAVSQVLCGAPGREQRIAQSREYIKKFENTGSAKQFANLYRELIASNV